MSDTCSHCGKQGAELKRCSGCKQTWYCGAECQTAGWKKHKKKCAPALPLKTFFEEMRAPGAFHDWRGILKWEGRLQELLQFGQEIGGDSIQVLWFFSHAHMMATKSTGIRHHALSSISIEERCVKILGTRERFRDQADSFCVIGDSLLFLERRPEATIQYEKARSLGAKHGFFTAECRACVGLGTVAVLEHRHEEALDLFRNAVAAAPLCEEEESEHEVAALGKLAAVLLSTRGFDEVT